ncbi:hypothetical protein AAG570_003538 [Ranatra chinensis]|uniref:THAP-type domain-containing protein n=1 Tax=Ranatra chinensis TaxID=642074 RepID=A0ABD0Y405_9HEMI
MVPGCPNTTATAPGKLFALADRGQLNWARKLKRKLDEEYVCEDHFQRNFAEGRQDCPRSLYMPEPIRVDVIDLVAIQQEAGRLRKHLLYVPDKLQPLWRDQSGANPW